MTSAYKASIEQDSFTINIFSEGELEIDGLICIYNLSQVGERSYSLILDGISYLAELLPESDERVNSSRHMNGEIGRTLSISVGASVYLVHLDDNRSMISKAIIHRSPAQSGSQIIRAPMPGLISRIEVRPGEEVSVGKGLIVLEAMKMENEIKSLFHGRILHIHVERGKAVEKGEQLITIEETSRLKSNRLTINELNRDK